MPNPLKNLFRHSATPPGVPDTPPPSASPADIEPDYLAAYADSTDQRVANDPARAVGGMWDQIGRLQYEFLLAEGLQPHHSLLDIGCGTLRGGRFFITHLEPDRYTGFDISHAALDEARRLVADERLTDKRPRLLLADPPNLTFDAVADRRYDVLLAQSVFTHLGEPHIRECFAHLHRVMHADSRFYFTHFAAPKPRRVSFKGFEYPRAFFEHIAAEHNLRITDRSADYPHPRGQRILLATT